MLVRVLFGIMAFVIMVNTSMAASHSGIKDAIDEFNYTMTVEGAALDPVEAQKTLLLFKSRLEALEASGVSRQEIIDTALASVTDERTAKELKAALQFVEVSNMSPEESVDFLKDAVAKSYQRGASWNGVGTFLKMTGIVLLLLTFGVTVLYVTMRLSDCPRNYTEEQCEAWDENVKW